MPTAGIAPSARDEIIRRNGWALAALATMLGGVIVLSNDARWSAPIWEDALRVPGAPPTWGVIMMTAGGLLLYGLIRHSRRVYHWGCCIAFAWCVVVTAVQLYTFLGDFDGYQVWWPDSEIGWALMLSPVGPAVWFLIQVYELMHNSGGTTNPMGVIIWGYIGYMYALRFKLSDKRSYE